jgi:acetolactate synthase-1/3 small subunit
MVVLGPARHRAAAVDVDPLPMRGVPRVYDRLICFLAADALTVPARVCGLLAQRQVDVGSIQMSRTPDRRLWWVQLFVRLEYVDHIQLLVKRISRLIDVIAVHDAGPAGGHQRRSVFVSLRPAPDHVLRACAIARLAGTELLENGPSGVQLHLCAAPSQIDALLASLQPYGLELVLPGAVSGIGERAADCHTDIHRCATTRAAASAGVLIPLLHARDRCFRV